MPDQLPRVAVVEDYGPMRALLVRDLSGNGFCVDGYADAASLWRHFPQRTFDLVVLNIGLPDEDGFSVSRRLRHHGNVAVVMLSGYGSQEHQLLGLREGADAYLVKPVDIRVLVATLQRLTQRLRVGQTARAGASGWCLSESGWQLRIPGDREVALNGYERDLLRRLAAAGDWVPAEALLGTLERPGRTLNRRDLAQLIWRLRRKIAASTDMVAPLEERDGACRFATLIDEERAPPR